MACPLLSWTAMRSMLLACVLSTAACAGGGATAPKLFPTAVYLGVEDSGAHYSAPIAVDGASPMGYFVADTSIARASGGDQMLEVGALKVGTTSVTVRNDFGEASASVSVATYSATARAAGAQAWSQFNCASCHDFGPDVTPSGIARRTDQQIAAAVMSGAGPDGGSLATGATPHMYATGDGIVAFLRSLPARSVPTP
jgi:hypothetical protein